MAAPTLSRRRAAALLGLLAWWLLAAPTDAEVAATCAEDVSRGGLHGQQQRAVGRVFCPIFVTRT
eukprot:3675018-Alexandrium_andersonii.AAC.1